jgi:hypothetical protein
MGNLAYCFIYENTYRNQALGHNKILISARHIVQISGTTANGDGSICRRQCKDYLESGDIILWPLYQKGARDNAGNICRVSGFIDIEMARPG